MNQSEKESAEERERERQKVSKRISRIEQGNQWQLSRSRRESTLLPVCHMIVFFFFLMSWTRNDKKFLWERSILDSSNTLRSPPIHRWHFNDDQYLRLFLFEKFLFEAERKMFDNRFCNIRKLLPRRKKSSVRWFVNLSFKWKFGS